MDFDFGSSWKLLWWGFGTLGIAGTIALAVAFPAIAKIVLDRVVRLFAFVLSYRVGCALVAAILAALIADYVRHSIDDSKHATELATFKLAQVARDKRIATETRAAVWEEIANATAENAVTDKDVKEFTDALPKPPDTGNLFRVGADACRLRALYGQSGCGPVRAKGMPKADAKDEGVGNRRGHGLSSLVSRIRRDRHQGEQGDRPAQPLRRQGN
jgi:hypothetical protein